MTFDTELYARIAQLPGIVGIKIPPVRHSVDEARAHIANLKRHLPYRVSVGISGHPSAVYGLLGGCDTWYSVVGGTLTALVQ